MVRLLYISGSTVYVSNNEKSTVSSKWDEKKLHGECVEPLNFHDLQNTDIFVAAAVVVLLVWHHNSQIPVQGHRLLCVMSPYRFTLDSDYTRTNI